MIGASQERTPHKQHRSSVLVIRNKTNIRTLTISAIMTSISPSITGTCLCTSISYTLTSPSLLSELCHCNNCKTASGSAFMMFDFCNKAVLPLFLLPSPIPPHATPFPNV